MEKNPTKRQISLPQCSKTRCIYDVLNTTFASSMDEYKDTDVWLLKYDMWLKGRKGKAEKTY